MGNISEPIKSNGGDRGESSHTSVSSLSFPSGMGWFILTLCLLNYSSSGSMSFTTENSLDGGFGCRWTCP